MTLNITREELLLGKVLLFDKPLEWSSFQLVNKVRWLLCKKFDIKKLKVGHAGTLDPLATGLMILCTGKATKQIETLMGHDKEYIAELCLGKTTPSYDAETAVNAEFPICHIDEDIFRHSVKKFIGDIMQQPPLFSAKKVNGVRAYHLARQGAENNLISKQVTIKQLEVLNFALPYATVNVMCSKGTYIRSLAHDIGKDLNAGAYLTNLCRTRIGNYKLNDAWKLEDFENKINLL